MLGDGCGNVVGKVVIVVLQVVLVVKIDLLYLVFGGVVCVEDIGKGQCGILFDQYYVQIKDYVLCYVYFFVVLESGGLDVLLFW